MLLIQSKRVQEERFGLRKATREWRPTKLIHQADPRAPASVDSVHFMERNLAF